MTDRYSQQSLDNQHQDNQDQEESPLQQDSVELQYPQLLLEASLQSLLTHSFSSSPSASTVVNMPHSEVSLQDSFIHVEENDTDDDTHSEVTDDSLLSESARDGAQTPTEDRESSDAEDEDLADNMHDIQEQESDREIRENYTIVHRSSSASHLPTSTSLAESAETLAPEESSVRLIGQRDTELFRSLTPCDCGTGSRKEAGGGEIQHSIGRRAFRILCYASPAVSAETKDEVLRKVGSVLVALGTFPKATSPYYHVIPAEFGPGSKPETADLIPIPVQMVVHELHMVVTKPSEETLDQLQLSLLDGASIHCDEINRIEIEDADGNWYQPDLLLVLTSIFDDDSFRQNLDALLLKAKAHLFPMIIQQESDVNAHQPQMSLQRLNSMDFGSMSSYLQSIVRSSACASKTTTKATLSSGDSNRMLRWFAGWFSNGLSTANPEKITRHIGPILEQPSDDTSQYYEEEPVQHLCPPEYTGSLGLNTVIFSTVTASVCAVFVVSALLAFGLRLMSGQESSLTISGLDKSVTSTLCSSASMSSSTNTVISNPPAQQSPSNQVSSLEQLVQMLAPVKKPETDLIVSEEKNLQRVRPYGGRLRRQHIAETCSSGKKFVFGSKANSLVVPQDFLDSDGKLPPVSVSVTRNGKRIGFTSALQRETGFDVKLDEGELHGVIDVVLKLDSSNKQVCAQVDLRDSMMDAMAAMPKSRLYLTSGNKEKSENLRLTLIHVRTPNWSDRGLFGQLKSLTINPIHAAEEKIEKSIIRQIRACSETQQDCLIHKFQDYRNSLAMRGRLIRQRAGDVVDASVDRVTLGAKALYEAMYNIAAVPAELKHQQEKVIETAAEAQNRARKLVAKVRLKKHLH